MIATTILILSINLFIYVTDLMFCVTDRS